MARQSKDGGVDLSESSVYGNNQSPSPENDGVDIATESALDRLEAITGGADEPVLAEDGGDERLAQQFDQLDASTDEEIDALKVDLYQDDAMADGRDGSGRVVDDVAEERLAELTEVGPDLNDEGALSVTPGLEDTSSRIRRHHPNSDVVRSEAVVEGNIEEPRDEERGDRVADEGAGG